MERSQGLFLLMFLERKKNRMKFLEKPTLREYLENAGIDRGSDAGFIVIDGNVEMQVSYRYLDCPAWKYLLDKFVYESSITGDAYGRRILKIVVVSEDEL